MCVRASAPVALRVTRGMSRLKLAAEKGPRG